MNEQYLEKTINYIKNTPIEYRKAMGQYFTNNRIVERVLSYLPITKFSKILEPSVGTRQFYDKLKDLSCDVVGVEIDKNLSQEDIINADFLLLEIKDTFDFIIGNPPYFETKLYDKLEEYKEVIYGRTNIYSLFIKKGIDLLKEGGYLSFVVPIGMNTSKYFSKLRDFIVKNCSIVNLEEVEFPGVSQPTQILTLRKEKNNGEYLVVKKQDIIFSNKYKEINVWYSKFNTISDFDVSVKTGSLVWNQHKKDLTKLGRTVIIWNENINEIISLKDEEWQRINKDPEYPYGIVFKRILSKENFCFVDFPFIGENHVNVIYSDDKEKLTNLYSLLVESKVNTYVKDFTGNSQLSKTELEELPLWASLKEIGLNK